MTDAPPILRSMDRDRLWGRDEIAAQLFEAYGNGHKIFGIECVSGDGQSEFVEQFARKLQEDRGPDPIIIEGGPVRTETELIASLYTSLTEIPCSLEQKLDRAASKFAANLPRNLKRLAGAIMKDIGKVLTLGVAQETIDKAADLVSGEDSAPDPFNDLLVEASANRRSLISRALEFVSDLGNPLCIVISDYEQLDTSARSFLVALLRGKPDSCVLFIAVNVEEPCASDWQNTMRPQIILRSGVVTAMPEVGRDELRHWFIDAISREPSDEEIDQLLSASYGGRAVYLKWLLDAWSSGTGGPDVPDIFDAVLRVKRQGICDDARLLGDLLSLLPGNAAVHIDLLGAALASRGFDLQAALDDATARGLIRQVDQRVRFGHSSYAQLWHSQIDTTKHATLRSVWYDGFEKIGFVSSVASIPGFIPMLAQDIVNGQTSDQVEALANELDAAGSKEDSLILHQLSYQKEGDVKEGGSE